MSQVKRGEEGRKGEKDGGMEKETLIDTLYYSRSFEEAAVAAAGSLACTTVLSRQTCFVPFSSVRLFFDCLLVLCVVLLQTKKEKER